MLKILQFNKDEYEFPALLVLGCFDAIHVGHRELIKKAKLQAKINGLDLGVMLFKDGKGGKMISSFEERLEMFEELNVKFVVCVEFDEAFKSIDCIDFLKILEDKINVKAFMSGKDFRFGFKAKGKSSTLKNYADDDDSGVWYMPVKDVELNGEKVSTTLIKSCLDGGDVKKCAQLLGYEFFVSGTVEEGARRGGEILGFPTANIAYPEWKYPVKYGVYSVKCYIDGAEYLGIANYGACPTFNDDRIILEAYVYGYSGDLYGKTIKVAFVDYIRDISEFPSAEALSEQLKLDLSYALGETDVAEVPAGAQDVPVENIEEPAPEAQAEEATVSDEAVAEAENVEEVTEAEPAEAAEEEVVNEQELAEEHAAEAVQAEEEIVADEVAVEDEETAESVANAETEEEAEQPVKEEENQTQAEGPFIPSIIEESDDLAAEDKTTSEFETESLECAEETACGDVSENAEQGDDVVEACEDNKEDTCGD